MDCTALATLPKLKRPNMELSIETTVLKIDLPPLEHLSKLTWTGCSRKRRWSKTRQYLERIEINSPVLVKSLVIQDFPALKSIFEKLSTGYVPNFEESCHTKVSKTFKTNGK